MRAVTVAGGGFEWRGRREEERDTAFASQKQAVYREGVQVASKAEHQMSLRWWIAIN